MNLESIVDRIDDHFVGIVSVVGAIIAIGVFGYFVYSICEVNTTTETIILHDGNQSYACEVSRGYQTPHNCNPIKEENEK